MNHTIPYLGELLALTTAVVWAFAVIFFKKSGESVHPVGLNIFKNSLAAILLVPTIWIFDGTVLRDVPVEQYWLLLFSGALGIGLADTLFFMSLNRLGAGLSSIVDCLYSPFIIGLSVLWLGEKLSVWQVVGVAMILSAVLTAAHRKSSSEISRHNLVWGIFFGVLAMALMAVGVVIVKPLLDISPLLWVTEIRLFGGIIVLLFIVALHPARHRMITSVLSSKGRFAPSPAR
jgi:drug/metabolite transporter (DMT)-like permease